MLCFRWPRAAQEADLICFQRPKELLVLLGVFCRTARTNDLPGDLNRRQNKDSRQPGVFGEQVHQPVNLF